MAIVMRLGTIARSVVRYAAIAACVSAFALHPHAAKAQPAQASIIVDANTGEVLYAQNADAQRFPASITKVMTLYMLFEQLEAGKVSMDTAMDVSAFASAQAPSKLGLRPGQELTVREAINALAIKSANDAAVVVAEHLGGSEENFSAMMTRKARSLGMTRTQFVNASGLPDTEQLTTARDLALLGYSIQSRFPELSRSFAKSSFTYNGRTMGNHNKLLGRVEGIDGIKTGYTRSSGFNLLSSMRVDGRHLIGVVLGGKTSRVRDAQMRQLLVAHYDDASSRKQNLRQFAGRSLQGSAAFDVAQADTPVKAPAPRVALVREEPQSATGKPVQLAPVQLASADASSITLGAPMPAPKAAAAPTPAPKTAQKPVVKKAIMVAKNSKNDAEDEDEDDTKIRTAAVKSKAVAGWQKGPEGKILSSKATPSKLDKAPYIVQIAAVPDKKSATAMLTKAKSKAPKQLANATPYTEPVKKAGDQLWRARFSNLDKASAENVCAALKKSAMPCMISRL